MAQLPRAPELEARRAAMRKLVSLTGDWIESHFENLPKSSATEK
jgi:hypothetical protein